MPAVFCYNEDMQRNGNGKFGHIMFAIAVFFIFFSFALYASFYRMASFLIRDSVNKTILWGNLLDRQIAAQHINGNN